MTSDEYRDTIKSLGLSQEQAADLLGKSLRTSNGYANGAEIPKTVEMLLRIMLRYKLDGEDVERLLA